MAIFGKITAKGQTTIPSEIRDMLGVGPGDHLQYIRDESGRVFLERAPTLASLSGILKSEVSLSNDELRQAIEDARSARADEIMARFETSIGVDTNLILRWLFNDSPAQTKAAALVFASSETIHVSHIVLAETSWVLSRTYRLSRAAIARALRAVVSTADTDVRNIDVVLDALSAYEKGGPGLADHLIAHLNLAAGCRTTLTFDKKAAGGKLFTQVT